MAKGKREMQTTNTRKGDKIRLLKEEAKNRSKLHEKETTRKGALNRNRNSTRADGEKCAE